MEFSWNKIPEKRERREKGMVDRNHIDYMECRPVFLLVQWKCLSFL